MRGRCIPWPRCSCPKSRHSRSPFLDIPSNILGLKEDAYHEAGYPEMHQGCTYMVPVETGERNQCLKGIELSM